MFFYKKKAWLILILIDVFLIYYKYDFADHSKQAAADSHESEYKPYKQIKVCHKRVSQCTSVWWSTVSLVERKGCGPGELNFVV